MIKPNMPEVRKIWDNYKKGNLSLEEAARAFQKYSGLSYPVSREYLKNIKRNNVIPINIKNIKDISES